MAENSEIDEAVEENTPCFNVKKRNGWGRVLSVSLFHVIFQQLRGRGVCAPSVGFSFVLF